MAQQPRPYVEQQQVGISLWEYFPIDANDAAFYNGFTKQLERYAFFEMIDRINNGKIRRRPGNGNDVVAYWKQRKANLINKGYGRSRAQRPDPVAQPPPVGAIAAPGPPPAPAPAPVPAPALTLHPLVSAVSVTPIIPLHHTAPQAGPTAPAGDNLIVPAPESICSSDGELSPRFIVRNRPHEAPKRLLSPTRGERIKIKDDLQRTSDLTWRFASTLYQTEAPLENAGMPPTSVYLFVGLDAGGIIRDQAVAKLLDIKQADRDVAANENTESRILKSLAPINCSHLQQFRGSDIRTTVLKTAVDGEDEGDEMKQTAMHLYTGFAACGDLQQVCEAHYQLARPIPEHFIWYTLKSLVEGMNAMRDRTCQSARLSAHQTVPGPTRDSKDSSGGQNSILHLDLKPANIFLETADDERPGIPKPIIGDFGIAETLPLPATYHRQNGSEGWLPPERNLYDRTSNQANPYAPRDWNIDERSELYSIGLIALSLTKAHKITIAEQETETKDLATAWLVSLSHEGDAMEGGRGPTSLDQLDPFYSVQLYKTLGKCLMTRPYERCSLDELTIDIDGAIQHTERLYGEKLKRSYEEMDESLKVKFATKDEVTRPFSLGTRFSHPRKRRKINLEERSDGTSTTFNQLANEWNDLDTYSRLTKDEMNQLMAGFNQIVDQDTTFNEESADLVAFRYLLSVLRKYLVKSMPVHYYTDSDWEDGYKQAFTSELRGSTLQHVRKSIVPRLQASSTIPIKAVNTFDHALRWGSGLNDAPGEPRDIQLVEPSILHQAVRHFVFKTPSGAFVEDGPRA